MSMVHCAWACSSSLADQPALQFLEALARGDQRGQDGRHLGRAVDRSGRLDRAPDGAQLAQFALGQLHAVHVVTDVLRSLHAASLGEVASAWWGAAPWPELGPHARAQPCAQCHGRGRGCRLASVK